MRLEISQRADLAVRALVVLHRSTSRLKSADLAAALGTTAGFVPQIMGPLVREGWVRSVSGPSGGYEASVVAGAASVLQVVETIDGPTDSGRCVVADGECGATAPCALHVAWDRARGELMASLSSVSVQQLAVVA